MDDLDLRMSEGVRPLYDAVTTFIRDEVDPITEEFYRLGEGRAERWSWAPGQLELLDDAKAKAREQGLWNFFLPDAETGEGLSNLDYAYIANELGKNRLASECLNCSAPDTGNMEVLERVGTPEQKAQWLEPLLRGEIRSAFAMTEPGVMSSDARQIQTSAVLDGDEWVISGEKFYISGAGDPRCKVMITMVRTSPDADTYRQQSQILVPTDTPGVEIVGPMHVFGSDDAPHGHMHIRFNDVRVPKDNLLLGEGRGFEISQLRLGPGRIHHCMRSIGAAELAIEMMVDRGMSREAFGKTPDQPGQEHGGAVPGEDRRRGDAAHGAACREGDGHPRQRRGPGLGQRGQGDGAGAVLRHRRRSDPDARCRGDLTVVPPRRHVACPPHASPRGRPRRGASPGRRSGRGQEPRCGPRRRSRGSARRTWRDVQRSVRDASAWARS